MAWQSRISVAVKSCTVLAAQADGCAVTTIEGLGNADGTLHPVQQAFQDEHALQCGYCTPGMVMAVRQLIEEGKKAANEAKEAAYSAAGQVEEDEPGAEDGET